jgi:hypothetical protein
VPTKPPCGKRTNLRPTLLGITRNPRTHQANPRRVQKFTSSPSPSPSPSHPPAAMHYVFCFLFFPFPSLSSRSPIAAPLQLAELSRTLGPQDCFQPPWPNASRHRYAPVDASLFFLSTPSALGLPRGARPGKGGADNPRIARTTAHLIEPSTSLSLPRLAQLEPRRSSSSARAIRRRKQNAADVPVANLRVYSLEFCEMPPALALTTRNACHLAHVLSLSAEPMLALAR